MILELDRTERMGYTLYRIFQTVGPVIGWIYTPLISCSMMAGMDNAVYDWITHIQIWMGHINLCPQCPFPIGKFASSHTGKQVQVFCHTALSVGTILARLGQGSLCRSDFIASQIADKCVSLFDLLDG